MPRPRFSSRRFLNRRGFHAGAHIIAVVDDTSREPSNEPVRWTNASLTIADCGRTVTLEFDDIVGNRAERGNALRKADILLEVISGFRNALEAEAELAETRERAARS